MRDYVCRASGSVYLIGFYLDTLTGPEWITIAIASDVTTARRIMADIHKGEINGA